jgi:D-alanyl-D-alanine carboxypeptidase
MLGKRLFFQETWKELMKDSQPLPKKNKKNYSKVHFFDVVIILLLLNIAAIAIVIFYVEKINSYLLPQPQASYLKVTSVPLSTDLDSINASAAAYVVYDTRTRSIIAGKNQNLRFSPASTAKVMTAILVLEHYKLTDFLTVPSNIYTVQGSKMNLVPGEEVSVENLLYGMLLPSGNDAAYTFAYYYPGGVAGFVNAMNKKASELGLSNTHFIDPAGYEDGNYTSGAELTRLAAQAMEKPEFAKIVRTRSIQVYNRAGTHEFLLNNLNELLQFDDVVGIKTGFTNEAGGVLLTAIMKDNRLFIVCVLKSEDRFADTKDLMQFIKEKVDFSIPKRN